MSLVTDMVLYTAGNEPDAMRRLNEWCTEADDRHQQFAQLDEEAAGGDKVFTGEVWAMAGNYFPHADLADALPGFGWRYPRRVVLIIDPEDGDIHVVRADPGAP